MTKISSQHTSFWKWIFPICWFGFLALFLVIVVLVERVRQPMWIVFPIVLAAFGFMVMKQLVWDLLDEVYDDGDALVVKNRGEEDRIALSSVMNVTASLGGSPPRVNLKLARASRFGDEVAFIPVYAFFWYPFVKNKVAEDLIVRVCEAGSKRAV